MQKSILFFIFTIAFYVSQASIGDLYAGIEVGSKGVKMNIIKVEYSNQKLNYFSIFDTTINSDVINFSEASFNKTIECLTSLYFKSVNDFNVSKENTFVAISSGVKGAAYKEKKLPVVDALINNFKANIHEPDREIEVLTVYRESILSHKGIISGDDKMKTILIDIGSGNTKGGYYITNELFNTFTLPWGTKSIYNTIEKVCDSNCNTTNFYNELALKLDDLDKNEFSTTIDKYGIKSYDFKIVFSGGIAWSAANLMFPDRVNEKNIDVSTAEITNYLTDLNFYFDNMKTKETNPAHNSVRSKVLKTFTQRNLIAGTALMLKVMKQFETKNNFKKFTFAKDTKVAWITAYIIEQVEKKQLSITKE